MNSRKRKGYLILIAAVGMMCSSLAVDVAVLMNLGEVTKPTFIAAFMSHIASVITAFIGGKLIPEYRDPEERTRLADYRETHK